MMLSQQQRQGLLFQTPLRSQDDFGIKYETFKDDEFNGDAHHNIERVNPMLRFQSLY